MIRVCDVPKQTTSEPVVVTIVTRDGRRRQERTRQQQADNKG